MHTTKQIIDNQTKFKEEIFDFFAKEKNDTEKVLNSIISSDSYINKEKHKLKTKFKKINQKNYIEHLFFLSSNRNRNLYAWWDEYEKECKILKYDQR